MSVRLRAAAISLAVALGACAADTMQAGETRTVKAQVIAPYDIHEECMTLGTGDRIDYRFESRSQVDFDIRYREGSAVISTISRNDVREASGVFLSPLVRRYCTHWQAGPQGAVVDYQIRLLPVAAPR